MNYCPFCQLPMDRDFDQCPSCHADLSEHQSPGGGPEISGGPSTGSTGNMSTEIQSNKTGSMTEPVEDLVHSRAEGRKSSRSRSSPRREMPRGERRGSAEESGDSALPYRPINRPPTLILCALDDGSRDEGEWFRVRTPEFRIGRTPGSDDRPNDIVIANDNGISSTHVEIKLCIEDGRYRYYLRDWPSRNGTFVRVSRAALKPEQELLLGARRYFFDAGTKARSTGGSGSQTVPKLVEMNPRGNRNEYPLLEGENLIGASQTRATIAIKGDPFVSSVHARIVNDKKNRWVIESLNSLNGIWLRIDEMALDTGGEFQIGEQRFLVKIT